MAQPLTRGGPGSSSHEVREVFPRAERDSGVGARVERLRSILESEHDINLVRSVNGELSRLRSLFKSRRELFDPQTLTELKRLSEFAAARADEEVRTLRQPALNALRETFGYDSFRPGQEELIMSILSGRDTLGIMPTGAGKSLTFQIPARLLGGTTLVVSPLIALMKDQVDALLEVGMRATYLNSSLEPEERADRLKRLARGEYELLYAAPEGLASSESSPRGK